MRAAMSRNAAMRAAMSRVVYSGRGVNNSNVLLDHETHVIVVTGENADEVRKYTDTLGTTSLFNALDIISNPDTSSIDKAKAIEDLILIRLILSAAIQFKEPTLLGLFERVIGTNFKTLPEKLDDHKLVEDLIRKIDAGEKDVTVVKHFILKVILAFGIGMIPAFAFALDANTKYFKLRHPLEDGIKDAQEHIKDVQEHLYNPINFEDFLQQTRLYSKQIKNYQHQIDSLGSAESFTSNYFISDLTFIYPIIIGLIASMATARRMINHENNIYSIALVKLIDRFFLNNKMIFHIINNPDSKFGLPKPLEGNQLGMALYYQYIRRLQQKYMNNIKLEEETKSQSIRNSIEEQTGTVPLRMSNFSRIANPLDDCAICLKPLAAAGKGTPIEVCRNHHMFHRNCIKEWIQSGATRGCPTCRGRILRAVVAEAQRGGKRRTRRRYRRRSTRKAVA